MTQRNNIATLSLAAFGITLLALGAWVFAQEGQTYLLHASTPVTSINLRSEGDPTGLGIATRTEVLRECDSTLRSAKSFELMVLSTVKFETSGRSARRSPKASPEALQHSPWPGPLRRVRQRSLAIGPR